MTTESQQQIAREAREEWFSHYKCVGDRTEANEILDKIILSAIERAIAQEHFKDRKPRISGKFLLSAQPQRSEQQEWTEQSGEYGKSALLVAITAALAAERQRIKAEYQSASEIYEKHLRNLASKLDAERQRRKPLVDAATVVLNGLDKRIKSAPSNAKPVFEGIADLHYALANSAA